MRRAAWLLGVLACSRPVPAPAPTTRVEVAPRDAGPCVASDGDGDGVVDECDVCPDEPGVGPDGCARRVVIQAAEIRITPQVFFAANGASVPPPGLAAIDEIAAVLRGHPEIRAVEVSGHASAGERGAAAIALRRAEVVRESLVSRGVEAPRLVARGYGSDAPADASATPEALARNCRVTFRILEIDRPSTPPERPRRWVPEGCPDAPTARGGPCAL